MSALRTAPDSDIGSSADLTKSNATEAHHQVAGRQIQSTRIDH
jgi:hypothetical protein